MNSKVVIFEDKPDDQAKLEKEMKKMGCEVKVISIFNPKQTKEHKALFDFKPQFAIVDSEFEDVIDGIYVVKYLNENFPGISIVVCTKYFNDPEKKEWLFEQYKDLPGVRAVIGKKPFPKGKEIIDLFKNT
jgi:hypothetical protein